MDRETTKMYEDLILTITECVTVTVDEAEIAKKIEEVRVSMQGLAPAFTEMMTEVMDTINANHHQLQPNVEPWHAPEHIDFFTGAVETVEEVNAA
jgi:hypothetical protein